MFLAALFEGWSRSSWVRYGLVRQGTVGCGRVNAADGSTEGPGSPCCSRKGVVLVWSGIVGQGVFGLGAVCRGRPIAADGSKEGARMGAFLLAPTGSVMPLPGSSQCCNMRKLLNATMISTIGRIAFLASGGLFGLAVLLHHPEPKPNLAAYHTCIEVHPVRYCRITHLGDR